MPPMIDTKPMKQMTGATFVRTAENISASKASLVELAPIIMMKPTITTSMLMPISMKLVFENAKS